MITRSRIDAFITVAIVLAIVGLIGFAVVRCVNRVREMVDFVLIVGLIIVLHRMRRAVREPHVPRVPIELHIYHHFDPDSAERQPDALDDGDIPVASTNVVRFRR